MLTSQTMPTILVVDDRTVNRELIRIIFSREGFRVCEASDGIEALRLLEQQPVDVILSDILMPNMDGYMLCMEVRGRPRFNALPFIFYTSSFTSSNDEALAMELGGDRFIRKPALVEELVGTVRQLLREQPRAHVPVAPPTDLALTNKYARHLVNKMMDNNEALQRRTLELHEASAKLQAVIRSAPIGIVAFDPEGRIERGTRRWNESSVGASPRFLASILRIAGLKMKRRPTG